MADEPTQAVAKPAIPQDSQSGPNKTPDGTNAPTYVGRAQCAECHRDNFEKHAAHGHASTFTEVSKTNLPDIFDQQTFDGGENYGVFHYSKDKSGNLTVSLPDVESPSEIPLQYVLGSGHNARTILTLNRAADGVTEGIEHRVSCYPDQRLGMTVGHGAKKPARDLEKFGDVSRAVKSLSVASTVTPQPASSQRDESIVSSLTSIARNAMVPEVNTFAKLENLRNPPPYSVGAADWDAESEIQLCGDCHRLPRSITKQELRDYPETSGTISTSRNAPQQMLSGIQPGNEMQHLPRPTSISPRHKPSRSTSRNVSNATIPAIVHIPSARFQQRPTVLNCHMPTVPQEQGIKFHDHWIRIHKD